MIPLTPFGTLFTLIAALMVLALPRRWAPLPLLVGTCYMTLSQGIMIGPFNFYSIRLLILVGLVRLVIRGERLAHGINGLDCVILLWSGWLLSSSILHVDPGSTFVSSLGFVFNTCGVYFLLRSFCRSYEDVVRLCRMVTLLLAPIAVEMVAEQLTGYNMFSALGGVSDSPQIREGRLRAQGPFAHAILAGTAGAVCLPLSIGIWSQHRKTSVLGTFACLTIVGTSASSGPILSAAFSLFGLLMWHFRHAMRLARWAAVFACIGLELIMKAPVYYLIARMDVVGGSTGWHRAALIEAAINHFDEWWVAGTDYTRHWLPMTTAVSWSPDHIDITSHYIQMGVNGGLPSMLAYIATLVFGFRYVGRVLRQSLSAPRDRQFFIWAVGASLFAHAATTMSVNYFDQSFVFLYLTLAAIATLATKPLLLLKDVAFRRIAYRAEREGEPSQRLLQSEAHAQQPGAETQIELGDAAVIDRRRPLAAP